MREIYTCDNLLTPDSIGMVRHPNGAIELRIGALSLHVALPSHGADTIRADRAVIVKIGQVASQVLAQMDQGLYRMRIADENALRAAADDAPDPGALVATTETPEGAR